MANIDTINKHRVMWQDKARAQLEEAFFLSLEGDTRMFDKLCEDVETSLMIVRRMDQKLENARSAV